MTAKGACFPIVLVVREIVGVHEQIRDICRRFTNSGQLALAPDLNAPSGRVDNLATFNDAGKVVGRVPHLQVMPELQPNGPIDAAADLKAPVHGLYGETSQEITVPIIEPMRGKLKVAQITAGIIVYLSSPHGFPSGYRPSYRKDMADDGWKRLMA